MTRMSDVELAKYFGTTPIMAREQLLKKPRIYASICDICDHARFMHQSYHSDYSIGMMKDFCCMEDYCDCKEFKVPTKPRDPFTIEAARMHVVDKILEAENNLSSYLLYASTFGREMCGHCHQYQYPKHIADHVYRKIVENAKDDLNHLDQIVEEWQKNSTDTDQYSSMPMKNSKSCVMFRCLKCFRYIFPDDEVARHGDGFVHKVCLSTENLIKHTSDYYQSHD